jgi:hypothetical protein
MVFHMISLLRLSTKIFYAFLIVPNRTIRPSNLIIYDFIIIILLGDLSNYEDPNYANFFILILLLPRST